MESSATIRASIASSTFVKTLLGAVLCIGLLPNALAANRLLDVKYHSIVDHQLELELVFESPVDAPAIDLSAEPAGISLHFNDTLSTLDKQVVPIDQVGVIDMITKQDSSGLNVIVGMKSVKPYQGKVVGNTYRLTINDDVTGPEQFDNPFVNSINTIDFRRNKTGGGELLINLNNQSVAANVEQVGSKLEIKLYNTDIGSDLLYVMDVQDFATPVSSFETFKEDLTARLMVDIAGNYEFNYKQDGNVFKVNIDKVERVSVSKEQKKYNGRSLSLNFQNISVRTVLQIIADYNNFNLVTSDTVEGNITLRLDDVPWDQALDLILQTKGLDKRIEGNILMVAPSEELATRESNDLKNKQEVKELAPLYSEYLQVNYAKASAIAELLQGGDNSTLLSSRGSVAVDERTNTLLVKDTAEILENIHRLIDVLDIPIKQVLIEARMVTVKDDVSEDLGIRWGITDQQGSDGSSGSLEGAQDIAGGLTPSIDDRLNVNLPAAVSNPSSIAFHVAKLADGTVLDLELSALEQENKGEIIASPRITTSNQKSAYIEQGVEIPYVESASSGATTVAFKKAVLSLKVTPQITPDDRVILDLEITQDSQGKTVDTPTGTAVSIDTQRIGTQVLVNNGETIVLGGIYQQNLISRVSKVPVLGDIPLVGFLFRNTSDKNERQELLIFVTPKIVNEDL